MTTTKYAALLFVVVLHFFVGDFMSLCGGFAYENLWMYLPVSVYTVCGLCGHSLPCIHIHTSPLLGGLCLRQMLLNSHGYDFRHGGTKNNTGITIPSELRTEGCRHNIQGFAFITS